MSAQVFKYSQAEVRALAANRIIRIVEYGNPEVVLQAMLKEFLLEIGFSSSYPNFGKIRIGTVHPFALLLFQEVSGVKLNTNVFPSITIVDSGDNETAETLAHGTERVVVGAADVVKIKGAFDANLLFMSDNALTRLETATAGTNQVAGEKHVYRAAHSIDFNIWAANKEITSLLYDFIKHFLVCRHDDLHNLGLDLTGGITGRRSGDINVEFGKLLYGANITVTLTISRVNMSVELPYEALAKVDVETLPDFQHLEE